MEPFSETKRIKGKIKQIPEDFIVNEISPEKEVLKIGGKYRADEKGDYVVFLLEKYNWENLRILGIIADQLGISRRNISIAGMKDKNAVTTQRVSAYNVPVKKIQSLKIKDTCIQTLGQGSRVYLGALWGNEFTITIRNISMKKKKIEQIMNKKLIELNKHFPNYFGIQRFGAKRGVNHLVGKEIINGNIKKAVLTYISNPSDLKKELEELPKSAFYEKKIISYLLKKPDGYNGSLKLLPLSLQKLFLHSYQSYLFNKTLSKAIEKNMTGYDLKLPLFGYNMKLPKDENVVRILRSILQEENLDLRRFRVGQTQGLSLKGSERIAFQKFHGFKILNISEDELNKGKLKIVVQFSLPKGAYATVLLNEFFIY